MQAIDKTTGNPVKNGDTVTNFRGETGTFEYATRAESLGKSGKVVVNGREYYDKVWNLRVPCEHHGTPNATACDNCDPNIRNLSQNLWQSLGL